MAASRYETKQYKASSFVESAGAILFKESTRQICLVCSKDRNEWLLAKGRRNIGESRLDAALREATEETGFKCKPFLADMYSRATPWDEGPQGPGTVTPDVPRWYQGVNEPFMITHRALPGNAGIKMIYWYVGRIDETVEQGKAEDLFTSKLFSFEEALQALKFATDREVAGEAIAIFEQTQGARKHPGP